MAVSRKDHGQQKEQHQRLGPAGLIEPHRELLAERIDAHVDRRDADDQKQAELRGQQRRDDGQRNAVASCQRIAEA